MARTSPKAASHDWFCGQSTSSERDFETRNLLVVDGGPAQEVSRRVFACAGCYDRRLVPGRMVKRQLGPRIGELLASAHCPDERNRRAWRLSAIGSSLFASG